MIICTFGDSITWGPRLPFRVAWANLLRNHLEKIDNLFLRDWELIKYYKEFIGEN
jgi:hypothetical protein